MSMQTVSTFLLYGITIPFYIEISVPNFGYFQANTVPKKGKDNNIVANFKDIKSTNFSQNQKCLSLKLIEIYIEI